MPVIQLNVFRDIVEPKIVWSEILTLTMYSERSANIDERREQGVSDADTM